MNIYLLNAVPVAAAFIIALYAVHWIYFRILYIAKHKNFVDNPDARKLQQEPIPVMGGIAVFFGVAMGLLIGYFIGVVVGVEFRTLMMPVLAAMVLMLYIGAIDDIMGLTPKVRFVIEIVTVLGLIFTSGGCIDTLHGVWGIESFSWWIAVPLTVFAGVGIINAVNMIDGVNGLSSSLCGVSCIVFGIVFMRAGDVSNAVLAFTTAGALLPFMVHNIFGLRSRMFIGDAGTMVMGLLMTWFTISLLRSNSPIEYYDAVDGVNLIAFALAVLCVPVFDTIRVMVMRIVRGESPFHPDKTHLHHVFVNVGVSHFFTAMTELLIMLVVVSSLWVSVLFDASVEWQLYIVILASMLFVWGTYIIINYHAVRHTPFLHWLVNFSIQTHLGRKSWWKNLSARLDAPEDFFERKLNAEIPVPPTFVPDEEGDEDRRKILAFMKGRAEVMVHDIVNHSGANPSRVIPILYEETADGWIRIIKTLPSGQPEIVTLVGKTAQ